MPWLILPRSWPRLGINLPCLGLEISTSASVSLRLGLIYRFLGLSSASKILPWWLQRLQKTALTGDYVTYLHALFLCGNVFRLRIKSNVKRCTRTCQQTRFSRLCTFIVSLYFDFTVVPVCHCCRWWIKRNTVFVQNCLTCFGANITVVMVVTPAMCVTELKYISEILSTLFFVAGLATFIQCTLGTRSDASCGLNLLF